MLKSRKTQIVLAGVGGALLLGVGIVALRPATGPTKTGQVTLPPSPIAPQVTQIKQINSLKSLPALQRTAKLEELASKTPQESPDRNRARYLLATDLLQQGQAKKALDQLEGLDTHYPAMAVYARLKQAQAYEQLGDRDRARATYENILRQSPGDPAAAAAVVALGRWDRKYEDQAIAQFPAYPRTLELVQKRLKQTPNQPQLMLVVAKHGIQTPGYGALLDRLVEQFSPQLKPDDWDAIAFGYWEKQEYGKAALAYSRAPYTPRNAYRIGRGLQLGEKEGAAAAYQTMVQTFPTHPETALALLRLSRITEPASAIAYLDQLMQRFPAKTGEALLEKSKLLEAQNPQAASQVRQTLLSQHGNTPAAAELRWSIAQRYAAANDVQTAWKWAEPILTQSPDSDVAPQAGFWLGKWAQKLGKPSNARSAYEWVLKHYPHSYYAWRSASLLGWQVGDFDSVRQMQPNVSRPASRPELPAGSATLKELHQLGQDWDAWALWQSEFQPKQPTVAEQFTDGIMRMAVGDYLDGIFMVSYLSERDSLEEKSQYQALRQHATYWQSLYPFPFLEPIAAWSQQRQLNPLLVTALIRQESRFMSGIQSAAGAKGLMQVMPDTAAWIASKINLKQYRLDDPSDNIKLGTWYLDYTHQEYRGNSLLAVASYNAGPGAVGDWLQKGVTDPDAFVEAIPYDETKGYVKSVFENYWNYLRLYNPEISQQLAQVSEGQRAIERSDRADPG